MSGANVVLLTALVPTLGHQFLLSFALNFANTKIDVIISTRGKEPTNFLDRVAGLKKKGPDYQYFRFHEHRDDNAPQQPSGPNDSAFWDYWRDVVVERVGKKVDRVFASEGYGADLADRLKAEYIPVDHNRITFPVKGSVVRSTLWDSQLELTAGFRNRARSKVVFTGADSTGKTTLAQALTKQTNGCYNPEWARLYLEKFSGLVTERKLDNIALGQLALEQSTYPRPELMKVFDTDLLTTLGFYRYFGYTPPEFLLEALQTYKDRLYVVTNDNIPFVPDPQRFGGDHRETNQQYWIDLLKEFGLRHYVIQAVSHEEQLKEVWGAVHELLPFGTKGSYQEIINFVRD